jgi:mRNA interferase MazF
MTCDAFDIVVVTFPFMERPARKRRPALVITAKNFNAANRYTALAMITTASGERWPDDHLFSTLQHHGLAKECFLRWKLFTLPNDMIERKLGTVEGAELLILKKRPRHYLPGPDDIHFLKLNAPHHAIA